MKKTTQLRELITSTPLQFIMEAHNALSAKIVEEAGFKGIWGSGLSISAAMGVRDNNEASWTQVLDVLEFMSDTTTIPILLDGDTGYGNFNNARRLVKKLEQRQIAGVCIEDKIFPKTNSFIKGEAQPLANIDEFSGKIKAMKDSQKDDDFVVISRVEAFIAGWGLDEALKRAEAYRKAGTDAILMHSKRADLTEIEAFIQEWGGRLPVVIVPTKYFSVPTERFRELGISLAIWANHNLRASIKAMQSNSTQIYRDETLLHVERNVSPLEEVFRLQGAEELVQAEKLYLNSNENNWNSIIIVRKPGKQPLVTEQINQIKTFGISDIYKVGGNDSADTNTGGELSSLYMARDKIGVNSLISYAEIIYKPHVLDEIIHGTNDITLIVDPDYDSSTVKKNLVTTTTPYSKMLYGKTVDFVSMTSDQNKISHGEFIGLWKVSGKGAAAVMDALEKLAEREDFKQLSLVDLFNYLKPLHPIAVNYVKGSWLDLGTFQRIQSAGDDA